MRVLGEGVLSAVAAARLILHLEISPTMQQMEKQSINVSGFMERGVMLLFSRKVNLDMTVIS